MPAMSTLRSAPLPLPFASPSSRMMSARNAPPLRPPISTSPR
eukprot:CAMPEP_0179412330 /NCGR_PEP_ID=MMETSP0799-20121207/4406_1 /TAXON_ID=46947 /ORGANISM="Geminigera cryophila, Strain CCMP2564" /LENGTH=41 /DNA_ID= /DNA_START= /DNA_END= /DNA_ORIENTATION=